MPAAFAIWERPQASALRRILPKIHCKLLKIQDAVERIFISGNERKRSSCFVGIS
jgi:hypothetical protein